jgi:hypothetical protein
VVNLLEVEPELRDPLPRPMRWNVYPDDFGPRPSAEYEKKLTTLLQQGVATRARILQCEWYDDGRRTELGPSVRARYVYRDQYDRPYIKTIDRGYDAMHCPAGYAAILRRTWRVGGAVTVLYRISDPSNPTVYHELDVRLVNAPPPKRRCPCCRLLSLEAQEFVQCPTCGQHTLKKPSPQNLCPVCGWVSGGDNPCTLVEGQHNFNLFGACHESVLFGARRPPYPEEIDDHRFEVPRLWFVGLSANDYWRGIWNALEPLRSQIGQGWRILIAEYTRSEKPPSRWWWMYEPTEVGFLDWRQSLEANLAPLGSTTEVLHELGDALLEGLMPRLHLLKADMLLESHGTDWSYWFLIKDDSRTVEYRFGRARR